MNQGRYVFTQLVDFLPRKHFEWLVSKYEGNKYVKSFSCWNHLLVLLFGQLSNREGLRDLIVTLTPFKFAFHHLGFGKSVTRSNLSKANETREVRIFQDFADRMVELACKKRDDIKDFFISNRVYAFDSSTISLCLSVYWWTKLHHGKGGVKLHELYDVKKDIPTFSVITDASLHDSQVMGLIPYEKDSFYIFDRAYMVTEMLFLIEKKEAFFVVREKHKILFEVVYDKNYNNPVTGIMAGKSSGSRDIRPKSNTRRSYVAWYSMTRRVTGHSSSIPTTQTSRPNRLPCCINIGGEWSCSFKWLKQHLRVKEFYGTSENAVKIQIYAAIIAYCLVVIVQEEMKLELDTYDVLRILNTTLLTKMSLVDLLNCHASLEQEDERYIQLELKFED